MTINLEAIREFLAAMFVTFDIILVVGLLTIAGLAVALAWALVFHGPEIGHMLAAWWFQHLFGRPMPTPSHL